MMEPDQSESFYTILQKKFKEWVYKSDFGDLMFSVGIGAVLSILMLLLIFLTIVFIGTL